MKINLSKTQKNILEWIICIVIAIVIAIIIKYFIGTPTIVNRYSMYPTLEPNERLILNRISKTFHQTPKRGEIITFEAPKENMDIEELDLNYPKAIYEEKKGIWNRFVYYVLEINKTSYIKRVIGLPGERIRIEKGKVYINGNELEEPYLPEDTITESYLLTDFTVPEGYVFAMGDNRQKSTDCRDFGCIPIEKIEGTVLIRFWPLHKMGKVR